MPSILLGSPVDFAGILARQRNIDIELRSTKDFTAI